MITLFRHKEMLKKDILRKRAHLERELQIEIQVKTTQIYNLVLQLSFLTERSCGRIGRANQTRTK